MVNSSLSKCLSTFSPISLQEMTAVKLMNRVDTKYVCRLDQLPDILLRASNANYLVQEVEGSRIASYFTTYYDTDNLEMYLRHHDRQLTRQKIRIRTYQDTNETFLEVKRKLNIGRTKKKRIRIGDVTSSEEQIRAFLMAKSDYVWENLHPTLQTNFQRITLVNEVRTERLTIDMNLQFAGLDTNETSGQEVKTLGEGNAVIIELKRDGMETSEMQHILQELRIKPMKISKYCMGIVLTHDDVKKNRFKSKLRKVDKLMQTL